MANGKRPAWMEDFMSSKPHPVRPSAGPSLMDRLMSNRQSKTRAGGFLDTGAYGAYQKRRLPGETRGNYGLRVHPMEPSAPPPALASLIESDPIRQAARMAGSINYMAPDLMKQIGARNVYASPRLNSPTLSTVSVGDPESRAAALARRRAGRTPSAGAFFDGEFPGAPDGSGEVVGSAPSLRVENAMAKAAARKERLAARRGGVNAVNPLNAAYRTGGVPLVNALLEHQRGVADVNMRHSALQAGLTQNKQQFEKEMAKITANGQAELAKIDAMMQQGKLNDKEADRRSTEVLRKMDQQTKIMQSKNRVDLAMAMQREQTHMAEIAANSKTELAKIDAMVQQGKIDDKEADRRQEVILKKMNDTMMVTVKKIDQEMAALKAQLKGDEEDRRMNYKAATGEDWDSNTNSDQLPLTDVEAEAIYPRVLSTIEDQGITDPARIREILKEHELSPTRFVEWLRGTEPTALGSLVERGLHTAFPLDFLLQGTGTIESDPIRDYTLSLLPGGMGESARQRRSKRTSRRSLRSLLEEKP